MKTRLRFTLHYIVGLIVWMLSLGMTLLLAVEVLFPLLGLEEENPHYDLFVILVFTANVIWSSFLFSWYFGGPLWFIVSRISQLSSGMYEAPPQHQQLYRRNNKLKLPYSLYEEVIQNLESLAASLQAARRERLIVEESKKDWIAGISHDLKTPLTYITGYSSLLLMEDYEWNDQERYTFITEIQKKSLHMEALIQDLSLTMQLNNAQSPLPLQVEPRDLIEFLKKLIADAASDPRAVVCEFSFHSECEALHVPFDDRLLYRALQNIMMNAILHNPPGTSIAVTVTENRSSQVIIQIADDGQGMDEQTLSNVFTKYYRGKPTSSSEFGTGLGMAIVRSLIEAHGGHITVDSTVGQGTTFTVIIPKHGKPDS
ncbi:sensor histidine kinase KdpD [Paenibacillus sp. YYML68]|uniref:sensor histidine kinase n=1 Tax=Paenibacillus sp. YYML68 TaxID=2909250 RepID=UPI002493223C|nr:HAMP domain-containing sensor histidine kinase [Paenibacillus sp. YYML68]